MGLFGEIELIDGVRPYYVYEQVQLTAPVTYWIFPIDYGFYYLLRKIHAKYPEYDEVELVYGPPLNFELFQRAQNIVNQVQPVSPDLFCTPGSEGVNIDAAGGLTAVSIKFAKLQNTVYAYKGQLEVHIHGYNGTTPKCCEIMMIGYLIPARSLEMWRKSNG